MPYRLTLSRRWSAGRGRVVWVMLNPSTADARRDDPTIRRCVSFSGAWGFGEMAVVNLFAMRATSPRDLFEAHGLGTDIVGPRNDAAIRRAVRGYVETRGRVVLGWGAMRNRVVRGRAQEVRGLLPKAVWCLGTTADGGPRHPLYVASGTGLTPWPGLPDR